MLGEHTKAEGGSKKGSGSKEAAKELEDGTTVMAG